MADKVPQFNPLLGAPGGGGAVLGLSHLLGLEPLASTVHPDAKDVAKASGETTTQSAAGTLDIATGAPALIGLPKVAIEAALNNFVEGNDKGYLGNFMEALQSDPLMKLSSNLREGTNNLLGVKEPTTVPGMIARNVTAAYLPAPQRVITSPSISAKLMRLFTPVVKDNSIPRIATQVGLGTGLDQLARAFTPEMPTIAEAAKINEGIPNEAVIPGILDLSVLEPQNKELGFDPIQLQEDEVNSYLRDQEEKTRRQERQEQIGDILFKSTTAAVIGGYGLWRYKKYKTAQSLSGPLGAKTEPLSGADEALKDIREGRKSVVGVIGDAAAKGDEAFGDASLAVARHLRKQGYSEESISKAVANVDADPTGTAQQFMLDGIYGQDVNLPRVVPLRDIERRLLSLRDPARRDLFNKALAAETELSNRTMALANDTIERALEYRKVADLSYADRRSLQDFLGQLTVANKDDNLREVEKLLNDNPEFVAKLRATALATDEDVITDPATGIAIRSKVPSSINPGMFEKSLTGEKPIESNALRATIAEAKADPEIGKLMKDVKGYLDSLLEYQVKRGFLSEAGAKRFRRRFAGPNGESVYLPLYQNTAIQPFFARLKSIFPKGSDKHEEMSMMSEHLKRSLEEGEGVTKPINVIDALRLYTMHTFEATNKESVKWNILARLSNVWGTEAGEGQKMWRVANWFGDPVEAKGEAKKLSLKEADPDVRYVGKEFEKPDGSRTISFGVDGVLDDVEVKRYFEVNDAQDPSPQAIAKLDNKEIMKVYRKGETHYFLVNDGMLRASMTDPQLSMPWKVALSAKQTLQKFTTGNLSLFSPVGFLYNTGQGVVTTAGQEGLKAALSFAPRSAAGAYKIWSEGLSRELGDYLAQRVATHTGIARIAPDVSKRLSVMFEEIASRNLLNGVRREAGGLGQIGYAGKEFKGSVDDAIRAISPNYTKAYGGGELLLLGRMIQRINQGFHEGAAYAATSRFLKDIENPTPQDYRSAVEASSKIVGDVRKMGGSEVMHKIHASIPFSGPTVQAWRVFYKAFKNNPEKFMAGLTTFVGLPTATEVAYMASLDELGQKYVDDEGKEWGYGDWFWNKMNVDQRNNQFTLMIPGKPPWEAIIIPLPPELSLARGLMLETLDTIYNFSGKGVGGIHGESGNHVKHALWRVLDIPVPPHLRAAATGLFGQSMRFGPSEDISVNPDNPGVKTSIISATPMGAGEQITRRSGYNEYVGDFHSQRVKAMLQDVFGTAGSVYITMADSFSRAADTSAQDYKGMDRAAKWAGEVAIDKLRASSKVLNFWGGGNLEESTHSARNTKLVARVKNMQRIADDAANLFTLGVGTKDGVEYISPVPPETDPVYKIVMKNIREANVSISKLDKEVTTARRLLNNVANAHVNSITGELLTPKSRRDLMRRYNDAINVTKRKQIAILDEVEKSISSEVKERLGFDYSLDLSSVAPRSRIPYKDSLFNPQR